MTSLEPSRSEFTREETHSLQVSEVWPLFALDLRGWKGWINSLSGSNFKLKLVNQIWYLIYFFTNFGQQY